MGNIRNMNESERPKYGLRDRLRDRLEDLAQDRLNKRVKKEFERERRERLKKLPKKYVDGAEKRPPRGFKKGLVTQAWVVRNAAEEGDPPNIQIQVTINDQRLTRFIPFNNPVNPDDPNLEMRTLENQMILKNMLYSISKRSGTKVGTFLLPGEKLTDELRADLEVNKQPVYPPFPNPLAYVKAR